MTSKKSKFFIICALFLFIVIILGVLFVRNTHTVPSFITDLGVVYIPERISNKMEHIVSIDAQEMWLFNLKEHEIEKIVKEIESGKFNKLESEHVEFLNRTGWNDLIISNITDLESCWIFLYDVRNNIYITDVNDHFTQWVVFLYDESAQKYYCVYQTI